MSRRRWWTLLCLALLFPMATHAETGTNEPQHTIQDQPANAVAGKGFPVPEMVRLPGGVFRTEAAAGKAAGNSAFKLARKLMRNGQLPGWSKKDRGPDAVMYHFHRNPDTAALDIPKKGDASTYHYEFTRTFQTDPWRLRKAWRTDQNDHMVEEYPVP